MAYTAVGRSLGDVSLVGGFLIPTASGSQATEELPNVFGDYSNHPLTLYMRAAMPGAFGFSSLGSFPDNVKLAMLQMQYQGQPATLLGVAVRSVAASNADDMAAPQSAAWNTVALSMFQSLMRTVVPAVAAMPKPLMHLTLNPAMVKCAQVNGIWDAKTSKCLPRIVLPATTRQGQIVSAPTPVTTTAPAAPSSSNTLYYVGAAAVALGVVGYLVVKGRRAP